MTEVVVINILSWGGQAGVIGYLDKAPIVL